VKLRKVRGSLQSTDFILWALWISKHLLAIVVEIFESDIVVHREPLVFWIKLFTLNRF